MKVLVNTFGYYQLPEELQPYEQLGEIAFRMHPDVIKVVEEKQARLAELTTKGKDRTEAETKEFTLLTGVEDDDFDDEEDTPRPFDWSFYEIVEVDTTRPWCFHDYETCVSVRYLQEDLPHNCKGFF